MGGSSQQQPSIFATMFIYNLIVGFGALSLPRAFADVGVVLGSALILFLAFVGYITATFVIEALAVGNAALSLGSPGLDAAYSRVSVTPGDDEELDADEAAEAATAALGDVGDEGGPLDDDTADNDSLFGGEAGGGGSVSDMQDGGTWLFEIKQKAELTQLAVLFCPRLQPVFFGLLTLYLVGDLAIYAAVIGETIVAFTDPEDDQLEGVRRMVLLVFGAVVIPISCLNFTKTTPLQVISLVTRNMAVVFMVGVALHQVVLQASADSSGSAPAASSLWFGGNDGGIRISGSAIHEGSTSWDNGNNGTASATRQGDAAATTTSDKAEIKVFELAKVPEFFGACIYSFMCHHSLPSIVTPMRSKARVLTLVAVVYIFIMVLYLLLCGSAVAAFGEETNAQCHSAAGEPCVIQDIYLLNFDSLRARWLADYLLLFPGGWCGRPTTLAFIPRDHWCVCVCVCVCVCAIPSFPDPLSCSWCRVPS